MLSGDKNYFLDFSRLIVILFKQKAMLLFLPAIRSEVFILLPGADQTPM